MQMKNNIIFIVTGFILIVGILIGCYNFFQHQLEKRVAEKFYLGENLSKKEKWSEASAVFEEIFKKYPRCKKAIPSMYYYAVSLEKLRKTEECYFLLNKIVNEHPKSDWVAPSIVILARAELDKGKLLEAQKLYKRIIDEFKNSFSLPEAWMGIAKISEEKGDLLEAKKFYERVINEFPKGICYSNALRRLGNLQIKLIFSSYPSAGSFMYKISSGDTLGGLARRFNTTVDLLQEANQLVAPRLSVGRHLKITPCHFTVLVNKSKNELELRHNEEIVKIYSVATGKFNSSPVGSFKITTKLKNPVWYFQGRKIPSGHPDNILGTRWIGISEAGYGMHGTTQPESIGTQSTRGCVRMLNKDVEELYKLVKSGGIVEIID